MYVYVYVCMYACMYMCVYAYVYVYVCVYVYTYTPTHTFRFVEQSCKVEELNYISRHSLNEIKYPILSCS